MPLKKTLKTCSMKKLEFYIKSDVGVSSVAIRDGTKILMGKRNDNKKWTLPGGHANKKETNDECAIREVEEEAGIVIDPKKLKYHGSKYVQTKDGEKRIHAHSIKHDGQKPTAKDDPDHEVKQWEWIETKDGLPEHVKDNLHSKKNVVFEKLGIKALFYIPDLEKAGGFKYLRKYKKGDKWIYIYHESHSAPGRVIQEEDIQHLKAAAEGGHEHSKNLLDTMEEHHPDKVQALRDLADTGHEQAKAHLKHLGIEHVKPEEKKIEAAIIRPHVDTLDAELSSADKLKVLKEVETTVHTKIFKYLLEGQYQSTPQAVKLKASGITTNTILEEIGNKESIGGILTALHEALKKIDQVHSNLTSQGPGEHKTYGNLAYNGVITALENKNILPAGYGSLHKRIPDQHVGGTMHGKLTPFHGIDEHRERMAKEAKEKAERLAKEKKEREERERRELAEVHGSMAHHMSSLSVTPMSTAKILEFHKALKNIFGKDLRKEDFPYNFEAQGLKVKIDRLSVSENSVDMEMKILDANGNNLINAGQRDLMRSIPGGGVIHVHANIDVGGYTWCNQGFTFDTDKSPLNSWRQKLRLFSQQHGINLTDSDLSHFTEPVHFAAFTNGKKYLHKIEDRGRGGDYRIKLSQKQIETKSVSGVAGEHSLTAKELAEGKKK